MVILVVAMAGFILLHLLVSGTRLRGVLTGMISEGAYMGLFSLTSAAFLAWFIFAFGQARSDPGNAVFWTATSATRWIQAAIQLIAIPLAVVGLTTPNPTSVAQTGVLEKADAIRGVLRITRHPFLWGVSLWAVGHILVNGNLAAFVLFGGLLLLAQLGTRSIDAKRERALGDAWTTFAVQTSNTPFAAIAAGRQSLKLGEIGVIRLAAGVAVWAAVMMFHAMAFGVPATPWV